MQTLPNFLKHHNAYVNIGSWVLSEVAVFLSFTVAFMLIFRLFRIRMDKL